MNKFWGLPKVSEKEKGLSGVRTWHWGRGAELRPFGCFLSLASFPGTHRIPSSLCLGLKNCKVDNLIKWCNKSTTCSKCKRAYYLLGLSQFQMETFKKKSSCVCSHPVPNGVPEQSPRQSRGFIWRWDLDKAGR